MTGLISALVLVVLLLLPGRSHSAPADRGVVVGLGGMLTAWDRERIGTYGGSWGDAGTGVSGGAAIYGGYTFNRHLELGLNVLLTVPRQDSRVPALLVRVLPQVKLMLPLADWDLYGALRAGYAFFRGPANHRDERAHGGTFGGALGAEAPITGRLRAYAELGMLYEPPAEISGAGGYLTYLDLGLGAGLLLRF